MPRATPLSAGSGYLIAIVALAAAIALRLLLDPVLGNRLSLITLFPAVGFAVWFGGYRPATVIAVLGFAIIDYVFIVPRGEFNAFESSAHVVSLVMLAASLACIIGFGEAMRRAQTRERGARVLYHTALSSIGDAVITADAEGRVTFMNPVAAELTGWPADLAEGRPLAEIVRIIDSETREAIQAPVEPGGRIAPAAATRRRAMLISRQGVERPIDDSAAPLRDAEGKVTGTVLVFRDVTAQRRVELALRESEARFRLMADAAPVMIWMTDTAMQCTWLNSTWLAFVGRPLEQELGLGWLEHMHPDDTARNFATYAAAFEARRPVSLEYRLRRHDGEYRWVLDHGIPLYRGTEFIGYIGSCVDLTERRRSEEEAARLAEEMRLVTDAMPALISYVGADARYRFTNRAYEDWFGHRHDDIAGQHLRDVLGDAAWERLRPYAERALSGERVHFETEVPYSKGGTRHIHAAYVPDVKPDGSVAGFFALITDIGERIRTEAALRDADRRKDEFLATLAHELRNPLAPIRNSLEIIKHANGDAPVLRVARDTMERQLAHLVRLVDDLLDVSRITSGRIELRRETVDLETVLRHAIETCRTLADGARHKITLTLPEEPVRMLADPVRLTQVFSNLVNNACKFTDPGGRVSVLARREGNEVVVSVTDDGIGIPKGSLTTIFEMFGQVDKSLERSRSGLGIGLSLARRLVELHGGSIEARSEGPGCGSEFIVRLPLHAAVAAVPPRGDAHPALVPRRILVVDDNRDAADSLARLLALNGHDVDVAFDGVEAVELAQRLEPDVILLDIGLPRLNGYDAARRIREQAWARNVRIVALTGWGQAEDRRRSREAGIETHLIKPVNYAALTNLLAARQPTR